MSQKKLRTGTWLLAVAAGAVLAGATVANAAPVRFDNPTGDDHFVWYSEPEAQEILLDIWLPADQQDGVTDTNTAIDQQVQPIWGALWGSAVLDLWTQGPDSMGKYFLKALDGGDLIPTADTYWKNGTTYFYMEGYESWWQPQFPDGEVHYIGLRFDLGDGYQYGWLEVVRGGNLLPQQLDVLAWGYETEPGVSIEAGAVPEPGTLALLAFGALAVAGRRRA